MCNAEQRASFSPLLLQGAGSPLLLFKMFWNMFKMFSKLQISFWVITHLAGHLRIRFVWYKDVENSCHLSIFPGKLRSLRSLKWCGRGRGGELQNWGQIRGNHASSFILSCSALLQHLSDPDVLVTLFDSAGRKGKSHDRNPESCHGGSYLGRFFLSSIEFIMNQSESQR